MEKKEEKKESTLFLPQLVALGLIASVLAAASQAVNQPAQFSAHVNQEIHVSVTPGASAGELPVYGQLSDFSFTERNGTSYGADELKQHPWIADFIYTSCTTECPLMSSEMARLQKALPEQTPVKLVSFTVDPEVDTPARLAEYAERFQAKPEVWKFLTGPREKLYTLAQKGFHLPAQAIEVAPQKHHESDPAHGASAPKENPFLHSQKFVLVDQDLQIRGYYDSTRPEELERLLKTDLPRLLKQP
ncbi:MAG: SCO family protein [Candidatus Sericytochromatia bacterium]